MQSFTKIGVGSNATELEEKKSWIRNTVRSSHWNGKDLNNKKNQKDNGTIICKMGLLKRLVKVSDLYDQRFLSYSSLNFFHSKSMGKSKWPPFCYYMIGPRKGWGFSIPGRDQ